MHKPQPGLLPDCPASRKDMILFSKDYPTSQHGTSSAAATPIGGDQDHDESLAQRAHFVVQITFEGGKVTEQRFATLPRLDSLIPSTGPQANLMSIRHCPAPKDPLGLKGRKAH